MMQTPSKLPAWVPYAAVAMGLAAFWVTKDYLPWIVAAILGFVVLRLVSFGLTFGLRKLETRPMTAGSSDISGPPDYK